MLYAINVRPEQRIDETFAVVQLRKERAKRAIDLISQEFIFYQPREQTHGSYVGLGVLSSVTPEDNSPFCILGFDDVRMLPRTLKAQSVHGLDSDNTPLWHEYAQPIRNISASSEIYFRQSLDLSIGVSEPSDGENHKRVARTVRVRNPQLRYDVFNAYGTSCIFSRTIFRGLTPGKVATHVGHLVPLRNGGADDISNALPMSPLANWLWDEGVIGLSNSGTILLSDKACSDTRAFIHSAKTIPFTDPKIWPRAEYLTWHRDNIFEKGPCSALFSMPS